MKKFEFDFEANTRFTIYNVKLSQSNIGRYGLTFALENPKVICKHYHTIWLGNYNDFQTDSVEKSTILWNLAKDFLESIGTDVTYLEDLNMFNEIQFDAIIDYEYSPFTGNYELFIKSII